jgi:haloalkane dehalogenase
MLSSSKYMEIFHVCPLSFSKKENAPMSNPIVFPADNAIPQDYTEHLVPRADAHLSVREYPGTGPAFVLMHGFPDNLHIYDRLVPLLRGRHVVTFDFLGWGGSGKPASYAYTSKNQEGDLDALVAFLHLEQVIPVAHDASGPVAINWSLDHPERVASLVLLNTYYADTPTLRFPEFIRLFADPTYASLMQAFIQDLESTLASSLARASVW